MRRSSVVVALVIGLVAALMPPVSAAPQGETPSGVDLTISVTGPREVPHRGTTFPVTLRATNIGTEAATDVSLSTYLAEALTLESYTTSDPSTTCTEDEYGSFSCSAPSLAPDESKSVTLTLTRTMARETWVDVWVAGATDEANWENNYGGIYIAPDQSNPADVQVEVTSPQQPELGEQFSYTAVVTNRGLEVARDVTFNQSLAHGVDYVSVVSSDPTDECTLFEETYPDEKGFDGAPYTYREVRCTLGTMRFAEQTEITVTAVRNDPHELWSSAWVSTSSWDQNYENDWADASTAGHPSVSSELAMTLTRPDGLPLVGDEFSYTLSVTNNGPAAAPDVMADTWLPEQLALRSLTPSRPGDVCTQNEYQGISCTFGNLAVGETASVTLDVTRVGAREFWMGGYLWSTNSDANYENNYAESQVGPDTSVPADIGVSMNGPADPAVGSNFDYTVTVKNNGPSPATAVSLTSSIPEGTDFVSATSPDDTDVCSLHEESYDYEGMRSAEGGIAAYTYREVRCQLGTLVPGESATVTITLTRTTEYEMWASAWVSTASYDENYENDYANVGSSGKAIPPCGVPAATDSGIATCEEGAGGGKDGGHAASGSYALATDPGRRVLSAGGGDDTITMKIPTTSKEHRTIVVKGGRGNDDLKVVLGPGAGNVRVVLRGGPGRDTLEVIAPQPGKRFEFRMFGGLGRDTCSSVRGDRHRSRAC